MRHPVIWPNFECLPGIISFIYTTACGVRIADPKMASGVEICKILKAYFSMKPAKKIFSLLGGKSKFELALQPSTASTAKIQIQFSRQGD